MKAGSAKAHHNENLYLPKVDISFSEGKFTFSRLSVFYFACYHTCYEHFKMAQISFVGFTVDDERSLAYSLRGFLLLQPLV